MRSLFAILCIAIGLVLAGCAEQPESRFEGKEARAQGIEALRAGDYEGAERAYNEGDYELAFEKFKPIAEGGFSTAQSMIGLLYENGQGVEKNLSEASKWYQLSADQGDAFSQTSLGTLYINGFGVPQDFDKARELYTLAAKQNYTRALFALGLMYDLGYGVPRNNIEAMTYYRVCLDYLYREKKMRDDSLTVLQRNIARVSERMSAANMKVAEELASTWMKKYRKLGS